MTTPIQPHEWTNADGEVLILRRIPKNRESRNGFTYPSGVGSTVECSGWNDKPQCGGGLHGWPWGFGLGEGMDYDIFDDVWLVLGAKKEDVVGELDGGLKCKFRKALIRFEGAFKPAWDIVSSAHTKIIQNLASGYASNLAASGYASKLAASGDDSKLAASGDDSVCAIAANCGRIKVGARGAFAIAYWDEKTGWQFVTGKVGKNGVKSGVWYCVEEGQLKEIK